MSKKKILIVDDESWVAQLVEGYLAEAGFSVITSSDGNDAMVQFEMMQPSVIILDLMLPGIDGLEVARRVRKTSDVPIIMLTARADEVDRVTGLELGADDYIVKPFSPRELVSRVRAVLRRASGEMGKPASLEAGPFAIDLEKHEALMSGDVLDLTPMEFDLLALLMQHPGRVYTRLQLLDSLLSSAYDSFERAIDAHVKRLRQKVEPDPKIPKYILTVYGIGYKFSSGEE
jgi:DNA-binding response OmpR family regulator